MHLHRFYSANHFTKFDIKRFDQSLTKSLPCVKGGVTRRRATGDGGIVSKTM